MNFKTFTFQSARTATGGGEREERRWCGARRQACSCRPAAEGNGGGIFVCIFSGKYYLKKHSSWNSLRNNYFAYFEEMFSAFFEDVFLKILRNCFGIFCGYNFFGLFQEFLAFFEEMIFSILWRKSLFVCICHGKCTGWSDKKANWGLWTWENCEGEIILLLVNDS